MSYIRGVTTPGGLPTPRVLRERVDAVGCLGREYDALVLTGGPWCDHIARCREAGFELLARRAERARDGKVTLGVVERLEVWPG